MLQLEVRMSGGRIGARAESKKGSPGINGLIVFKRIEQKYTGDRHKWRNRIKGKLISIFRNSSYKLFTMYSALNV